MHYCGDKFINVNCIVWIAVGVNENVRICKKKKKNTTEQREERDRKQADERHLADSGLH